MVAAEDVGIYYSISYPRSQSIRYNKIIYTPTRVLFSRLKHIAPPRILYLFGIEIAVSVRESGVEKVAHLLSFLIGKSCAEVIGPGIF